MKANLWRRIPTLLDPKTGQPRKARAVVVLMGWWGAKPRHLDKYVELYQDILPSAAIIAGTATPRSILVKDDDRLAQFAREGLQATASTMLENENAHLPILVHVFSNGGGYVWHQMMNILDDPEAALDIGHDSPVLYGTDSHNGIDPRMHYNNHGLSPNLSISTMDTEETPLRANTTLSVLRQNIRCQIYDSSPAYPRFDSGIAALEGSGMITNRIAMVLFKCLFLMAYWVESLWDRLRQRPHRLFQYWNDLLESEWDIPQGFIYSKVDRMVDADHLQEFIEERQQRLAVPVSVLRFDDSPHVQHFRYHPEQYREFLDKFIHKNLLRTKKK